MSNSATPPPSPPSRHASGLQSYRNRDTMLPNDPAIADVWRHIAAHRALPHQEAYAIALAANRLREPQALIGYRLYWMSDSILGSLDVYAQPSGYAVVGRHSSCDVVLNDERVVSLRHVLVRASALDDGFPVLSVLDLQSTSGFELSDGSKQRSVAASGPVVFRIGTHSLVAIPSAGRCPDVLPVPHVERGEHGSHRVAPVRIERAPARDEDSAPVSRITLHHASVDLSQRRSVVPQLASPAHDASYVPTGEGYEVTLESRGGRAGVRLSKSDLEHGVLIGRAHKCVDEGLRSVLVDTISRVHVLLIREKGECHLYDVASSVGTFVEGQRVRCHPLPDFGTTVQLASRTGVTLQWRAL